MGIIIARLIWEFDLQLDPKERQNWLDQPNFLLWQKGTLMIRLTPRHVG